MKYFYVTPMSYHPFSATAVPAGFGRDVGYSPDRSPVPFVISFSISQQESPTVYKLHKQSLNAGLLTLLERVTLLIPYVGVTGVSAASVFFFWSGIFLTDVSTMQDLEMEPGLWTTAAIVCCVFCPSVVQLDSF